MRRLSSNIVTSGFSDTFSNPQFEANPNKWIKHYIQYLQSLSIQPQDESVSSIADCYERLSVIGYELLRSLTAITDENLYLEADGLDPARALLESGILKDTQAILTTLRKYVGNLNSIREAIRKQNQEVGRKNTSQERERQLAQFRGQLQQTSKLYLQDLQTSGYVQKFVDIARRAEHILDNVPADAIVTTSSRTFFALLSRLFW